jgi:hypothetical protein
MVLRRAILIQPNATSTRERENIIMVAIDKNKPSRQDRLRKILSGLSLHEQSTASITFGGVAHAVADLLAQIQKDITATDDSDKARAAWLEAVQRERDSHLRVDPLLKGIKQFVMLQFGDTQSASTTLADFGYTPRKVRTVSPATQVAAATKAKATRTVRRTMGTIQRLLLRRGTSGIRPRFALRAASAPSL